MVASELISNIVVPLSPGDSIQKSLDRMNEFKVYHMPIVDGSRFLGVVTEEE